MKTSSATRLPFWVGPTNCLEHVAVLATRPMFGSATRSDSAAYGWFIWGHGYSGAPTQGHLDWRGR
jgi:hypothetical protein